MKAKIGIYVCIYILYSFYIIYIHVAEDRHAALTALCAVNATWRWMMYLGDDPSGGSLPPDMKEGRLDESTHPDFFQELASADDANIPPATQR